MSRVRDESSGEEMQGGVEARGEGGGDNECGGCKCVIIQSREWRVARTRVSPATLACYPYSLLHSVTQLGYKW